MTKKRISLGTRKSRSERRRRYHYFYNTPFIKFIKPEYHHVFQKWYNAELKKFIKVDVDIKYDEIHYFCFKLKAYDRDKSYSAFVFSFAKFLTSIGKRNGLTDSLSMIFRYITDNEHSNLIISENDLKRRIYDAFRLNN